ncbi:hypothetical protein PO909_012247 [Leuciscus waleckii]
MLCVCVQEPSVSWPKCCVCVQEPSVSGPECCVCVCVCVCRSRVFLGLNVVCVCVQEPSVSGPERCVCVQEPSVSGPECCVCVQEPSVSGPIRELSLWEWRHWQNRPLHTHSVGHSERCLHFTNIMELIDRLRQEEQGDCSFESELALHLQEEDVHGGRTTEPDADRIPRKKRTKSHTESRSEDQRGEIGTTSVRPIPSAENRLDTHERVDPESHPSSKHECLDCLLGDPEDESSDLQHMFYQPEQSLSPKRCRHSLTTKAFQMILADVEDLLSGSPPQGFRLPDLCVFPKDTISDEFQVTFSLASANREREDPGALSPGWDELFDDDDDEAFTRAEEEREEHREEHREKEREEHREEEREKHREEEREEHREAAREEHREEKREGHREEEREKHREEHREAAREEHREAAREEEREEHREEQDSLDLFGDDEAFLQLSVPDIRTPDKSTGPEGEQADEHDTGTDQVFHCSQDFFSVNFDLGFESEEEECVDATSRPRPVAGTGTCERSLVSDPRSPETRPSASTPNRVFPGQRSRVFPSQTTPSLRTELFHRGLSSAGGRVCAAGVLSSDSEGEAPLRTSAQKANPVFSPEQSKICSDVESPVQARRKPAAALNTSEDSDDFQEVTLHRPRDVKPRHGRKPHKVLRRKARQFLDEEAELSEDEEVSSDEDDGDEQNSSLQGFVVNTTQCSQGLNDSEMQAFYLKSVRSPAVQNQVRMTYKPKHNVNVFSQVPEQDETYAEDSFVFDGSEDEEGSVCDEEPVELIAEDSYVDGRKLYATRRRVRIRAANATVQPERSKRSRIVRVQDSSEEEEECEGRDSVFKVPQCLQKRQRLSDQASLSEELDFHMEKPVNESIRSVSDAPLRVLVDSRCISAGSEVVSRLRLRHGLQVQVCSLVSADFIVSSRMCVDLQSESEVSSVQNRRRLTERIQRLQEERGGASVSA